jgi:hypothetical protein
MACKAKIEFSVLALPSVDQIINDFRDKTSVKFLSKGRSQKPSDCFIKRIENNCPTKVENQMSCLRYCE